jgi:hypothetical protein
MHNFVQRLASSRRMLWGGLALLGLLTVPVSSGFAQEYDEPASGYGYGYEGAPVPAPPVMVAPPSVVYAPEYRRPEWPEWRWRWRHWHRHHAQGYYHRYYRR